MNIIKIIHDQNSTTFEEIDFFSVGKRNKSFKSVY